MSFTALFVENFLSILGGPIGSMSLDTSGTTTIVSTGVTAVESLSEGIKATVSGDVTESTLGTASITSATITTAASLDALEQSIDEYEITQAYVESLNEEELTELIEMLDEKEKEFEEPSVTLTLENHNSI